MPGFLDFDPQTALRERERLIREARWSGHSNDYQIALAQTLARSRPDFLVNFHFNDSVHLPWALRCIKMTWGRFERLHLGRNYYRSLDRCTGPFVLENLNSNEHANVLPRMAPSMKKLTAPDIRESLLPLWKQLVSKGDVYVEKFYRERDEQVWESRLTEYVVKQVRPGEVAERVFWLEDFWPSDLSHKKYDQMNAAVGKKRLQNL